MGKYIPDPEFDKFLNELGDCDKLTLCADQPTSYSEATTSYMLGEVAVDSGDFSLDDGDIDGRKLVIAAQNAVPITGASVKTNTGHVAIVNTVTEELKAVTTTNVREVLNGDTANIATWSITVRDAV